MSAGRRALLILHKLSAARQVSCALPTPSAHPLGKAPLLSSFALTQLQSTLTQPDATADDDHAQAKVKRMLYRARQRGHLELDLIVGLWAEENVPSLKPPELRQLQEVLECENPDLFKWLTGQDAAPSELASNDMFKSMQRSVQSKLKANRPKQTAAPEGKAWVRGWDDSWRENSPESATVPATGEAARES